MPLRQFKPPCRRTLIIQPAPSVIFSPYQLRKYLLYLNAWYRSNLYSVLTTRLKKTIITTLFLLLQEEARLLPDNCSH